MKTVYFVRHGEAAANAAGIVAGAELDSPLTQKGKEQAKRVGQDLKAKNIELIISSPISRALNTAKIIAEQIGYEPGKIIESSLFTERTVGIYSAIPYPEYRAIIDSGKADASVETVAAMHQRVREGLNWIKTLKEGRILIVSHSGTGKVVRLLASGVHLSKLHTIGGIKNAEVFEFTL